MNSWSRKPAEKEIGAKLRILNSASGPIDRWRPMEDEAACMGNTLSLRARMDVHVSGRCFQCRLQGTELQTAEITRRMWTDGYGPSAGYGPEDVDR